MTAAVEPINRSRGPGYITYTGQPDYDLFITKFKARFGQEPEKIFEDFGYTFVGPVPDLDDDLIYMVFPLEED